MTQDTFLDELSDSLKGEVDDLEYQESMTYYRNYIAGEVQNGKSEEEVIETLGSPRLIAKSIIEASANNTTKSKSTYESQNTNTEGQNYQNRRVEPNSNSWSQQLVRIIMSILAIVLVIVLITGAIQLFFPIIIVVLLVQLIRRFFN